MTTYQFEIPEHARKPYEGTKGRACVYARVSGESDPKTASLETQAQGQINALVAAGFFLDYDDVKFERFSGVGSLAFRDELLKLRDLVEDGYYQAFAVHDPDRLVRGIEVVQVVNDMEAAGCQVWLDGKLSEPSDERDLLLAVGGWASKKEAKQILERTMRGRRRIRENGEWYGAGPPCYGLRFDKEHRRRVCNELHAPNVLRIFTLADDGLTPRAICRILNDDRIVPPSATLATKRSKALVGKAKWTEATVRQILKDESYVGKAYINQLEYKRDEKGRVIRNGRKKLKRRVPRDQWIEVPGRTDPIVPEDLFHRVGARLRSRDRSAERDVTKQEKEFLLLRGLIYCGLCRKRMYPKPTTSGTGSDGKKYLIYSCQSNCNRKGDFEKNCPGSSVAVDKVDVLARSTLDALIAQPKVLADSIELAFADGDESEGRLRRERDRTAVNISELDRQLAGYVSDLKNPILGDRGRKAILNQMSLTERQIEALERTHSELESQLTAYADRDWLRSEYTERYELIRRRLEQIGGLELTDEEYRLFMEGMGIRLYFHRVRAGSRAIRLEAECQPGPRVSDPNLVVPGASRSGCAANYQNALPAIRLHLERVSA